MKRRHSKIRIAVNRQSVLSLLILLAMVIGPLDIRTALVPCVPAGHDCCERLHCTMSGTCPVSAAVCSLICSQGQSATFLVKSCEAAGRTELHSTPLISVVVAAPPLGGRPATGQSFSPPVSPPLTPLSQTCLLL